MQKLQNIYNKFTSILEKYGYSVFALAVRLFIAQVFFLSGLAKLDNWENTLFLFEYEYAVPLIPVTFAAYSATFFELVAPVFIALGLFTRLAVLPLIAMTAVIEFTYQSHAQHIGWFIALFGLFFKGAGIFSADHLLTRFFNKKML